jgi:hypothetical protein
MSARNSGSQGISIPHRDDVNKRRHYKERTSTDYTDSGAGVAGRKKGAGAPGRSSKERSRSTRQEHGNLKLNSCS